jgi:DNA-binding response OmpR family regulator
MLTARASDEERVDGLRSGADDYLVKPFSPRGLVARLRAVLRRTRGRETQVVETLGFDCGRLEIDTVQHLVRRDGQVLGLTPNKYKLLLTLSRYPGRAHPRDELISPAACKGTTAKATSAPSTST